MLMQFKRNKINKSIPVYCSEKIKSHKNVYHCVVRLNCNHNIKGSYCSMSSSRTTEFGWMSGW